MTISVAIATYNEQENISRCLNAIQDWVDEIIIVDGQSTDKTIEFAKKYKKVKIISKPNPPIFHINKQIAIDACKSDWILQLDADEVVSHPLVKEIQQTIEKTEYNGFWINRKNFFLNRFLTKGGQYPDSTIRLYKKGKGKLPCLSVHEQAQIDGKIGHLQNDLEHYADADFSRYILRNNRYTTLIAQDLKKENLKINFLSFLNYFFIKPLITFITIYFRHKGFVDGFPGFIFAYFSALSYQAAYTKYYGQKKS